VINTAGGRGAGYARNQGTTVATSPNVLYLDADDTLHPLILAQMIAVQKEFGSDVWVYCDLHILHEDGKRELYDLFDWNVEKLWRSGLAGVTCLHPIKMWKAVGGFDETLAGREDWDFHLRLANAGLCGVRLPVAGYTYRHATGLRRREGQQQKEIELLHGKYELEKMTMACRSCKSKSAKAPASFEIKSGDTGFQVLEYIIPGTPDRSYRGRTGRIYRIGSTTKPFAVHPSDVDKLLRLPGFRIYVPPAKNTAAEIQVDATPAPVSIVDAQPKVESVPVPAGEEPVVRAAIGDDTGLGLPVLSSLTVSGVKDFLAENPDLPANIMAILVEQERAGKNRKGALSLLEG